MNFSSKTSESNSTLSKIIRGQSDKSEHIKMSLKYYICEQKVRKKISLHFFLCAFMIQSTLTQMFFCMMMSGMRSNIWEANSLSESLPRADVPEFAFEIQILAKKN